MTAHDLAQDVEVTQREQWIADLQFQIAKLDAQLAPLQVWLAHLACWRAPLCDRLLALPPRIRDSKTLGRKRALELSILTIDRGTEVLEDTGWDLTNLPLTPLMVESGFEPVGADPSRSFSGTMPWLGGEREVSKQVQALTKRRDALQAKLAEATLSEPERAARDAENAAYRNVLNSMRIKGSADGQSLVAWRDGRELETSELTADERNALARANREHANAIWDSPTEGSFSTSPACDE